MNTDKPQTQYGNQYGFSLLKTHFKQEELSLQTISGKRGHTALDARMLKVIEENISSSWGITKKGHINSPKKKDLSVVMSV